MPTLDELIMQAVKNPASFLPRNGHKESDEDYRRRAIRVALGNFFHSQPGPDIDNGGWDRLADKAADAGYERSTVLRYRTRDAFTSLTIRASYQQGWRDAVAKLQQALGGEPR